MNRSLVMILAAACLAGCTQVGYVPIRTGVPARSNGSIRLHAGRDIGRPYEPLGYVYLAPMAKGDALHDIGDDVAEFDPADGYYRRFLTLAAENGADAIVDLQVTPVLNSYGWPICFGLAGLAVRFVEPAPGTGAGSGAAASAAAPPAGGVPVAANGTDQVGWMESTGAACVAHDDCPAGQFCAVGGRCRRP